MFDSSYFHEHTRFCFGWYKHPSKTHDRWMIVCLYRTLLFLLLTFTATSSWLTDWLISCLTSGSVDINKYCTSYVAHMYIYICKAEKTEKYYLRLLSMFSIYCLFINSKEAMIDGTEIQELDSFIHQQQHFC